MRDSGRRTSRGAIVSRAASGPCPPNHLTPKQAEETLQAILDEARQTPLPPPQGSVERLEDVPTFGDAVEDWLTYLRVEKRRKRGTVQDARYVAEIAIVYEPAENGWLTARIPTSPI